MSYNGSGVYTLPGAQLANGEIVSATENNQFRNDVASALNVAWTRDGQAPATGNIPMGTHKFTGLAAGTGNGDSVRFEQLPSPTNKLDLTTSVTGTLPVANGGSGAATLTGILKGNGTSAFTAAVAGTDYLAPAAIGTTVQAYNAELQGATQGGINGMKNRIINGAMRTDQRNAGASQTFTAGAALAYSVDRWYGYCTGANVTGQQVAGSGSTQNRYQFTGAASVTAIGFGQRIEQFNSYDLAGSTATLSVDLANSLLTTVTWTAYYANTANTFGTLASPTRTQIATGTFTVNSTVTNYNTQISIPAAATTGIEIVLTVGAQTSGTWTIGNVQLEKGSTATSFDYRPYGTELALCQRYYYRMTSNSANDTNYFGGLATANGTRGNINLPVTPRVNPTVGISSYSHFFIYDATNVPAPNSIVQAGSTTPTVVSVFFGAASTLTAGRVGMLTSNNASAWLDFSAEL